MKGQFCIVQISGGICPKSVWTHLCQIRGNNIALNVFWPPFKNSCSEQTKTSGNRGLTPPSWICVPAKVWSTHGLGGSSVVSKPSSNYLEKYLVIKDLIASCREQEQSVRYPGLLQVQRTD